MLVIIEVVTSDITISNLQSFWAHVRFLHSVICLQKSQELRVIQQWVRRATCKESVQGLELSALNH